MHKNLQYGLFGLLFVLSIVNINATINLGNKLDQRTGSLEREVVSMKQAVNNEDMAALSLFSRSNKTVLPSEIITTKDLLVLQSNLQKTGNTGASQAMSNFIANQDARSKVNTKGTQFIGVHDAKLFQSMVKSLGTDSTPLLQKFNNVITSSLPTLTEGGEPSEFPWLCREWITVTGVPVDDGTTPSHAWENGGYWHYFACRIRIITVRI